MRVTVLGSGTSHGVPMIGCTCAVCTSPDPLNKRFRPSILVSSGEYQILVDTTPELRMQSLALGLNRVDSVLITHTHADHVMGLDDLRRFNDLADAEIPVYGAPEHLEDIRRIYPYIFMETQKGGGKPRVSLHPLPEVLQLADINVKPMQVFHGKIHVTCYRFEQANSKGGVASLAYVTDVSSIPEATFEGLRDLDVLILDAVRFEPHPTHFGLYQALEVIERLRPRRAYLTHLSHLFEHHAVNAMLPDHVRLSYDGLNIEV